MRVIFERPNFLQEVCLDNLGKLLGLRRQNHKDGSLESDKDFRKRCASVFMQKELCKKFWHLKAL